MKKIKEPKAPKDYKKFKGMIQLFVLVSVSYSTYIVFLGTTGITPKVMLIPQALYAAFVAINKFTK
jgi:hypothetical protein